MDAPNRRYYPGARFLLKGAIASAPVSGSQGGAMVSATGCLESPWTAHRSVLIATNGIIKEN